MKKLILAVGVLTASIVNAQNHDMTNILKIGLNGGFAIPKENTSANLGVDLSYQNLATPGFGLGVATGYNHFFGRDSNGISNNDVGLVPLAALFRFYPKQSGFYAGADLGYGFLTGDKNVASNFAIARPNGGFYLKPELGYHNQDWNFFLHYTKVFTNGGEIGTQKYNVGSLGAGFAYNIPLGN